MALNGIRVVAFESRRGAELATLLRKQGAEPMVAPSVVEHPIEDNPAAFAFAERLLAGELDMAVFLTGVGLAQLRDAVVTRYPLERFVEGLRRIVVAARGPKPAAVLRQLDVPVTVQIGEPNTWREVLQAVAARGERRIAVQEYGRPNRELIEGLRELGREVFVVPVYRWRLPADTSALEEASRRIAKGACDVAMFTSSVQLDHLLEVAARLGIDTAVVVGLASRVVVASIGPVMTEALRERGVEPDIVPEQSKLGFLVHAVAAQAVDALARKRARA